MNNTSLIKQRSDIWFEEGNNVKVSGSTIFQTIDCDTLKRQKEHFDKVVIGIASPEPSEAEKEAMNHGTNSKVHQIAMMCGITMPLLYSELTF